MSGYLFNMKKIFFLLFLFIATYKLCTAQILTPINGYGQQHKRLVIDSFLRPPQDTIYQSPYNSLAVKSGKIYVRNYLKWDSLKVGLLIDSNRIAFKDKSNTFSKDNTFNDFTYFNNSAVFKNNTFINYGSNNQGAMFFNYLENGSTSISRINFPFTNDDTVAYKSYTRTYTDNAITNLHNLTVDNSTLQLDAGTTYNGSANKTISIKNLGVTNSQINDVDWSKITSKPTTVSGYGITDAVTTNTTQTISASKTFSADQTISSSALNISGNITAPFWGSTGLALKIQPATFTDNSTTTGTTVGTNAPYYIGSPTLASTNTLVTYNNPTTLFVKKPIAGTNAKFFNSGQWQSAITTDGAIIVTNGGTLVGATNKIKEDGMYLSRNSDGGYFSSITGSSIGDININARQGNYLYASNTIALELNPASYNGQNSLYGYCGNSNQSVNIGVLNLKSTINTSGTATGVVYGMYYNPTITALSSNTPHRFLWNTTGDIVFNTTSGNTYIGTTTGSDKLNVAGNLNLTTAGNKIKIATGANASVGNATLVNGVVTVNTTAVTSNSAIRVSYKTGVVPTNTTSILVATSITAGTSFTVTAYTPGTVTTNTNDNNQIEYFIIN